MLENANVLMKIKENKERFSIHSLINKYKLSEEDAKELCKDAQKDKEIQMYYFFSCQKCNALLGSGIFTHSLLKKQRNCYVCKSKAVLEGNSIEILYEAKTLLEKLEEIIPQQKKSDDINESRDQSDVEKTDVEN